MWKGFLACILLSLFLWFGLQLFLDYNTNLMVYDKTSLNFIIVNGILMVIWLVLTVIITISELTGDKSSESIFTEFYVADVCTITLLTVFGIVYWLLYHEKMKPKITDISFIEHLIAAWVVVLAIILILIYLWRQGKKEDPTWGGKINISRLDTAKDDKKQKEALIRSLPTIIYQDYHNFKTKEWAIWDREFSSGESLKVFPEWYHLFHSDCIKQWYLKRGTWPVDELSIDKDELNTMKATFEADLVKRL